MIKNIISKILAGDYDPVGCMNHENHKSESALEGLSSDSKFTFGLDNRGEIDGLSECVGLAFLLVFVVMFFPLLMTYMP